MTKSEYLESQRGKTYSTIVADQPMGSVVGSIRGENLRDVVAILASGLRYRLDTTQLPAEVEPLRTALLVAFKYLDLPDYAINLALPANVGMLQSAVSLGLVTQAESDAFFALATYMRPIHNITRQDCADHFGPDWTEITENTAQRLNFQLNSKAPETTSVVVQWQDASGDWYHATAIHGILAARTYQASLPFYGTPRKLRWKCEYMLDATVTVV